MAEPYCEPADIKNAMPDTDWGTAYEGILHNLAGRASRVIDTFTGRRPGAYKLLADETLYFTGDGSSSLWVELAQAPTTVAVDEDADGSLDDYVTWAVTNYKVWPPHALIMGQPYQRLDIAMFAQKLYWPPWEDCIKIIGRHGYSTIPPEEIVQASIIQAGRWFKRGQQAFQDTGAIAELGKLTYTKRLDPDVDEIIDHYKRVTI